MNLEFKSTIDEGNPEKIEEIVVLGKKVGTMYTRKYDDSEDRKGATYYHAAIKLPGYLGLIQGFASTKEEAVADAIFKGKSTAKELLHNIHEFEAHLSA